MTQQTLPIFGRRSNAGTLAAASETHGAASLPNPSIFTLKSSDASRAIQFSTDGGVEFFTPIYDVNSATMLVVATNAPLTNVKFTGAVNDTWRIN